MYKQKFYINIQNSSLQLVSKEVYLNLLAYSFSFEKLNNKISSQRSNKLLLLINWALMLHVVYQLLSIGIHITGKVLNTGIL